MGHSFGDGVIVAAIVAAIVTYLYFGQVERKRRLEIIHQERLAAMDKVIPLAPTQDCDPYDRLQNERRQQAVLALVEDLPEVYQSALRLHYWLGESMSGIAALHDVPENTVKSYLHRARRLLHARRRVRPRRLTSIGRAVIAAYVVGAVAATVWLMRDLQTTWIVAEVAIGTPVAAAASIHGRRLAVGP
jgi:RNA polymerase sigma factor (sigma-70 family)